MGADTACLSRRAVSDDSVMVSEGVCVTVSLLIDRFCGVGFDANADSSCCRDRIFKVVGAIICIGDSVQLLKYVVVS